MRRHALDPGSPDPRAEAAAPAAPGKRTLTGGLHGLSAASTGVADDGHEVPHRAAMEQAFGTSFEHVEAHTGDPARAACDELGASAFAVGSHVAFADASPDRALVAHELTHVLQQGGGAAATAPQAKGDGGDAAHEAEADAIAAAVASGESVAGRVGSLRGAAAGSVQRQAKQPARSPTFAQARAALIETRYLVEATWNDVERVSDGTELRTRIAETLAAARGTVVALAPQIATLSEAERGELAPVANALQLAAGRLVAKNPATRPAWNELFTALFGVFGPGLMQARVADDPARPERAALARRALEQAKALLVAEVASPSPDGIANEAVFSYLSMARAALPDAADESLRPIVEEIAKLVQKIEYRSRGAALPRLRELRAHLGDVREAAGLERGGAEGMDAVIEAAQEPSSAESGAYTLLLTNIRDAIEGTFGGRANAVTYVEDQSALQDPPRPTPLWQQLAMMAIEMATGAIVSKAVGLLADSVAFTKVAAAAEKAVAHPVPRPLARVLDGYGHAPDPSPTLYGPDGQVVKSLLSTGRDWVAGQLRTNAPAAAGAIKGAEAKAGQPAAPHAADPRAAVAKPGETPSASDVKPAFFRHQRDAVTAGQTRAKNGVASLENSFGAVFRRNPESTLALLHAMLDATNEGLEPAKQAQVDSTTSRYVELVAQSNHGNVQDNIEQKYADEDAALHKLGAHGHVAVDVDDRVEERNGMDLRKDVELKANAMNLANAHFRNDGTGVLSIRLEESWATTPSRIAKAWITGLNGPLRDTLSKIPLSQMNIAVRVHVPMKSGGHVSFARNPQGEIFADGSLAEDWCRAKVRSHGGEDRFVIKQAARIVIEQELGPKSISDFGMTIVDEA